MQLLTNDLKTPCYWFSKPNFSKIIQKLSVITCYSSQENYEIIKKIGRGKYSEVYEGINTANGERIVIKILKPGNLRMHSYEMTFSEEDQDQKRNQDIANSQRRSEHH